MRLSTAHLWGGEGGGGESVDRSRTANKGGTISFSISLSQRRKKSKPCRRCVIRGCNGYATKTASLMCAQGEKFLSREPRREADLHMQSRVSGGWVGTFICYWGNKKNIYSDSACSSKQTPWTCACRPLASECSQSLKRLECLPSMFCFKRSGTAGRSICCAFPNGKQCLALCTSQLKITRTSHAREVDDH